MDFQHLQTTLKKYGVEKEETSFVLSCNYSIRGHELMRTVVIIICAGIDI